MNIKTKFNSDIHKRKSIRLKGYDYSRAGLYFITICTHNKENLFGKIEDGIMDVNPIGEMISKYWNNIPKYYEGFVLHDFVVMPNHIHGIIEIVNKTVGADLRVCPRNLAVPNQGEHGDSPLRKQLSIPEVIQRYKSFTTTTYIKGVKNGIFSNFNKHIWQRGYYENIIRSEKIHQKVSEYIKNNPVLWKEDKYFE